jgi:imidazolonepropionase-like amidohydrolase
MRLKEAGADIIKTMASGMVSLKQPGTVTSGGFSGDELQRIVGTAAEAGLAVMVHANGEEAIMAAAKAGVRSIEHGFFMTGAALELVARNRIFWVPTTGALIRAVQASAATDETRRFVAGIVERHLRMIGLAHQLGVPLAIGTDCVLPDRAYGAAYQAELSYFRQAGIPEDAVTRIATENGARLLGLTEQVKPEKSEPECV